MAANKSANAALRLELAAARENMSEFKSYQEVDEDFEEEMPEENIAEDEDELNDDFDKLFKSLEAFECKLEVDISEALSIIAPREDTTDSTENVLEDDVDQDQDMETDTELTLVTLKKADEDIEELKKASCICGSSDGSRFMIGCVECEQRFHGDCVRVGRIQAKLIKNYLCPKCQETKKPLDLEGSKPITDAERFEEKHQLFKPKIKKNIKKSKHEVKGEKLEKKMEEILQQKMNEAKTHEGNEAEQIKEIYNDKTEVIEETAKVEDEDFLTYYCDQCDHRTDCDESLENHKKEQHTNDATMESSEEEEEEEHKPDSLFNCAPCEFVTSSKNSMNKHFKTNHPNVDETELNKIINKEDKVPEKKALNCDQCSFVTMYSSNLRKHIYTQHVKANKNSHLSNGTNCEHCSFVTSFSGNLKRHYVLKHSNISLEENIPEVGYPNHRTNYLTVHLDFHFISIFTGC